MTQTSYIPNNGNCIVPSTEEFHRYAINRIDHSDFCTDFPPKFEGKIIGKTASSIRWTKRNTRENVFKMGGWKVNNRNNEDIKLTSTPEQIEASKKAPVKWRDENKKKTT